MPCLLLQQRHRRHSIHARSARRGRPVIFKITGRYGRALQNRDREGAGASGLFPDLNMVGRTISHFEILEKLGEGGMGVVYCARDLRLDRLVALKILPPDQMANPHRRGRFEREAKTASSLNHPNIVTIHEIETIDGLDYIAMEWVRGSTLRELIPSGGMTLADVLNYANQIAAGLSAAHGAGIVHRDVKPANIMVTKSGLVKLLDFGLAQVEQAP